MSQVPTVRGPVNRGGLRPTYGREHICTLTPGARESYPDEQTAVPAGGPRRFFEGGS
jgi:hypothetical protein